MRKIKFITDSTSDIPQSLVEEYDIEVVPLHVLLGETDNLDDGNISAKDLFEYADSTGVLPKSAAVNEFEFEAVFSKWLEADYDIFFAGISSELSATIQAANAVAEKLAPDRISILDTRSLSTGESLILLEAADKAKEGAALSEVTEYAKSLIEKVEVRFVVDTLKYLYMGGRCSLLASIMGAASKSNPFLSLKTAKSSRGISCVANTTYANSISTLCQTQKT